MHPIELIDMHLLYKASFTVGSPEHARRLYTTTTSSVYPVHRNLERIASDHPIMSIGSSEDVRSGAYSVTGSSSERLYQRSEPSNSSSSAQEQLYLQNETMPSMISHQILPSYRQASMSEEGATQSCHSSPVSDSAPYLPGSSPYFPDSTLPDILHSHISPRLPHVPPNQHRQHRTRHRHDEDGSSRGNRHRQRSTTERSSRHRNSSSWATSTSSSQIQEGTCKEPCVKCMVTVTSFRWVLVVLSILGVSCVVTGIVLAALHAAGQSYLFLAIMFIGLGVLLVIVVGVGWKCTPRGHEPLHALFGIGSFMQGQSRGRRHRRHRNRDRSWFGGMMYPEFQFRRPPPSYAASMQDYQNQVMPAEQGASPGYRNSIQNGRSSPASSPPPSYRSRTSTAHSGIYTAFPNIYDVDHPNSRPPTYRSRAPSRRPSFPHEYGVDLGIHEDEIVTSLPYVSYLESSTIYISPSIAQTLETAVLSETSTPSNIPITGSPVTEAWSESLSPLEQSISLTSQIQTSNSDQNTSTSDQNTSTSDQNTSTSDRNTSTSNQNIETDNKNASDLLHGAQNIISDSSVSSTEQRSGIDASQNDARPPSLHQRMLSEDRHILEQTLQSLEHMIESSGISNEGAVFDEQEHITDFQ